MAARANSPLPSLSNSLRGPTQLTYLPKAESFFCILPSEQPMSIRKAASEAGEQSLVVTTMGDDVSLTPAADGLRLQSHHSRLGEYGASRRITMTPTGEILTGRPMQSTLEGATHLGEEALQYLSKYSGILEPAGINVHLREDQSLKPTSHGLSARSVIIRELYKISGVDSDGTRRLVDELRKNAPTTFSKVNPQGETLDNSFLWVAPDDSRATPEGAFSVNGAALSAAFESSRRLAEESEAGVQAALETEPATENEVDGEVTNPATVPDLA
ncbi:hypothetical protein IAR50_002261 [Cryptococcus sp. DSM 104548]